MEYKSNFPVPESDIAFFAIEYKICYLYTFAGRKIPLNSTLEFLELILNPVVFYRANRKTILKRELALGFKAIPARKLEVTTAIDTKSPITIPKAKVAKFKKWLKIGSRASSWLLILDCQFFPTFN